MPDTISTRIAVALILGAFVLGYLLAEWYFDELLKRSADKLAEDATTIEDLVSKNDAAKVQLGRLRQYEAIFGKEAIASTSYDV